VEGSIECCTGSYQWNNSRGVELAGWRMVGSLGGQKEFIENAHQVLNLDGPPIQFTDSRVESSDPHMACTALHRLNFFNDQQQSLWRD